MFEPSETYVALCPQEMKAKFNKCVYQEMLLISKEALLKVPRRLPKLKWIHCCITITPNLFVLRVQESFVKWMFLLKVILWFRKLVQKHLDIVILNWQCGTFKVVIWIFISSNTKIGHCQRDFVFLPQCQR